MSEATPRVQNRLRIASVCRLLPTPRDASAGTFILNRLEAMAELADVTVFQPVPYFPRLVPQPEWSRESTRSLGALTVNHAPMFYVPRVLKKLDGHWLARSIRGSIARLAHAGKLDAIDAHFGYPEGVGCALVARELGMPCFITIRGLETDVLLRPGVREQLLDALRGAQGVISVSHSLKTLVVEHGIDPTKVLVAPNAVNREVFRPRDRRNARRELGVSDGHALIVSVGHLLSVKRHDVLIDAVARLRETRPVKLVVIGGQSYEPALPAMLAAQVRRLGLEECVTFAGKLPPSRVATWLNAADAFALASAREGCCNAVLEALASGAPVVATRVGDNPYFVKEDSNGLLAPPNDVAALAGALTAALSRTWPAEEISAQLSVGTWRDTASRVLDFIGSRVSPLVRSAA